MKKNILPILLAAAALSTTVLSTAFLSGCGKSTAPAQVARAAEHGEAHAAPRVTIDADAARDAGIAISQAGPAALKETVTLYGVVQANADRTRTVIARFPGIVQSVHKMLGDSVQAGDVLATIESNDSLQTYALKSPLRGTITTRDINSGETVAGETLFTVTDLGTVWVDLSLSTRDIAQIKLGQEAAIRAVDGATDKATDKTANKTTAASGKVVWLSALGSASTQSRSVRVLLNNEQGLWTPGLYVVGDLTLSERSVPLAVKATALQTLDGKSVVFIAANNTYEARAVKIGASDGALTEILEGLEPNTPYVSANSFVIKADIEKSSAEHEH